MRLTIRPATVEDCYYFAPRLREADQKELWAAGGDDPLEPLLDSFEHSDVCNVAVYDGIPVCIFGVAPLFPGVGTPWALGTPQLDAIPKTLTRVSARSMDIYQAVYPTLLQFVSVDHKSAILWLARLGFQVTEVISDFGPRKQPFLAMSRTKSCVTGGFPS